MIWATILQSKFFFVTDRHEPVEVLAFPSNLLFCQTSETHTSIYLEIIPLCRCEKGFYSNYSLELHLEG